VIMGFSATIFIFILAQVIKAAGGPVGGPN